MENLKIIIAVLVVILLGVGAFVGFSMYQDNEAAQAKIDAQQQAQAQAEAAAKAQADALAAHTKCTAAGNYFVVTLDHDNSAAGQDILVKQKVDGQACNYAVADGDFELKNADAQYYKDLSGNGLLVDVGTAPSGRKLRIYDLRDKSMVTEKDYYGDLTVASGTLSYFGIPKAKITDKTCKGTLTVKKNVDLTTFLVKETKETFCATTQ